MAYNVSSFLSFKNITGLVLAPVLFVGILLFGNLEPGKPQVTYTMAIAILMALWWITEIIPLAVTALIPVVLFPLFGIT